MTDSKKYYYLKLKDNFFERPEIKAIESKQNGYEYICIIQKMYLRSLSRNGKLMLTDVIPYDIEILSHTLGHKQETVKTAIELFSNFGLCEILEDNAIYMTEIQNFIGKSSTEADRIREYRSTISSHKNQINGHNVTNVQQMYDERTPEIELKKEIKKKKEINGKKIKNNSINHQQKNEIQNSINTLANKFSINGKEKYGPEDGLYLTQQEYESLILKFKKDITDKAIEKVYYHKLKKGIEYPSDYGALMSWGINATLEDIEKEKKSKSKIDEWMESDD